MRWISGLIFFAVLLSVLGGVHFYLWKRLIIATGLSPALTRLLSVGLWGAMVLVLVSFPLLRVLPLKFQTPLFAVAFTWLGVMFLMFLILLLRDAGLLTTLAFDKGLRVDQGRRLFFSRLSALGVGAFTLGLTGYSVREALKALHVKTLAIPVRGLPAALEGFRIVQVTDIHVGPTIGKDFIVSMVGLVNSLRPDLVAITGDLVDGSVENLASDVAPLAGIQSRHGVFFVPGNHEYYSGLEPWLAHLPSLGIQVMRNRYVTVGEGEAAFHLAGLDDETGTPDMAAAVAGRDPRLPLIVLAHQPRTIRQVAPHGAVLQLSGHTHAGQIWPFTYLVHLQQPFVSGLHKQENTYVYVSPGTGYWGPPMRLGTQAEVTLVTLTRAS